MPNTNRIARCGAAALLLAAMLATAAAADTQVGKLDERVRRATEVYRELLKEPDRSVPQALLDKARCVAVIPHVIKGAIGYGARYGRGVISCRDSSGVWSPPCFITLTGGSVGFQIGGESSDIVLFFMTDHGARSLIESKFTLGGKASVAAGPVGRSAEASTDVKLDAEIYSYAKSKGLFAGVSLEGARLAPDDKANAEYYGAPTSARALLFGHRAPKAPPEAREFLDALPH
ncbi:MAG TPA: lipid-binding SYLF domain-containing protein [Candidatus Eisenbacteria bacterium]|nr:lipid-binding SYLF domain-containing protein [Candidatus Eisenbacteria bacterium]